MSVCPECRNGKHVNCNHEALDFATDEIVSCECPCQREGKQ